MKFDRMALIPFIAALAACGQPGALYLPDEPPPKTEPAAEEEAGQEPGNLPDLIQPGTETYESR